MSIRAWLASPGRGGALGKLRLRESLARFQEIPNSPRKCFPCAPSALPGDSISIPPYETTVLGRRKVEGQSGVGHGVHVLKPTYKDFRASHAVFRITCEHEKRAGPVCVPLTQKELPGAACGIRPGTRVIDDTSQSASPHSTGRETCFLLPT